MSENTGKKHFTIFTALTGIAIAALSLLLYSLPYHIVYQERMQMFLYTWTYFCETLSSPGGLCDYVARFLTQFFLFPWAGALIYCLLFACITILVWRITGRKVLYLMPLSLAPSILMAAYALDANAMPCASVSLLFVLAASHAVIRIGNDDIRRVVAIMAIPLLYWACGPLSLAFVMIVGQHDWKALLAGFFIALTIPLVARVFVHIPLKNLFLGVHYHRFMNTVPVLPWIASLCAVAISFIGRKLNDNRGIVPASIAALAVILGGFLLLSSRMQGVKCRHREESFQYLFLLQDNRWDDIKKASAKHFPYQNPSAAAAVNLAYAMTGNLPEGFFSRFQNGSQGLIPAFHLDFITPLSNACIFWNLGLVNDAQRYAYEAQETIPDHQKSAMCCKMIASGNLAAGRMELAEKYLDALQKTLFYRHWALGARQDKDIIRAKETSLEHSSTLFTEDRFPQILEDLYAGNKNNILARDYCLCMLLLRTDIHSFADYFARMWSQNENIPELYAEGLLLSWAEGHPDFKDLPWSISKELKEKCAGFISEIKSGASKSAAKQRYGNSYWFYFFFNDAK